MLRAISKVTKANSYKIEEKIKVDPCRLIEKKKSKIGQERIE